MRREADPSNGVKAPQPTSEDTGMPAVENLHIVGSDSSSQGGFNTPDTDSGQPGDGKETTPQVDPLTALLDSLMTDESASLQDRVMESPPRVLAENNSKANQGTVSSEESISIDLCDIPETPSKNRLKRPAVAIRPSSISSLYSLPILPRKRKRGSVFDLEDDEEENETQQENTTEDDAHMYSISFTPINRRQPTQLGDLEETRLNTVLPPLEELLPPTREVATIFGHHRPVGNGHDGPLKSKVDPQASSKVEPQLSSKRPRAHGKYPFHNTYATVTQESPLLPAQNEDSAPKTPRAQRRLTAFDWDEHELFTEASTANNSFRSARALALSVERRRAEKAADLSDSIRTAHE